MKQWNETIVGNATFYKSQPLVPYTIDGGLTLSGVLDVARQVKERIKAYAYAYRVTGDQGWVNRTWDELQVISLRYKRTPVLTLAYRMLLETVRNHLVPHLTTGTLSISSILPSSPQLSPLDTIGSMINGVLTKRMLSCGR